jgi:hypothetical protein
MERAQPASPEKEAWDVLFGKGNSSSGELMCCPLSSRILRAKLSTILMLTFINMIGSGSR